MARSPLAAIQDWAARRVLAASAPVAAKENPVGGLVAQLVTPGHAVYTPRSFEALAREGFDSNGYVFRAISIIAQACAGIPWVLYRAQGGASAGSLRRLGGKAGRKEITDHPLLDLLTRPHGADDLTGTAGLIEQMMAYRYLTGNTYLQALRPTSRKGPPLELWVQRPDRMRVVPGADGSVAGYEYTVSGRAQVIAPEDVLHWKTFAPLDDWYGLSPVGVAARVVDQMNASNDWNTALMQNQARPSGFLVVPGTLSDTQFERLERLLRDKYRGAKNAGRPGILEGGMTWSQIGLAPVDLEWLEGKKENVREIAVALGVPTELLGDSTNKTYSNYQEARRAFYQETVLPNLDALRDALNAWLVPMYGDDALFLDYDRDDIEALQEERDQLHNRVRSDYIGGVVSLNEAREAIGMEAIAQGDVFLAPPRAFTLDQLLEGAGLQLVGGSDPAHGHLAPGAPPPGVLLPPTPKPPVPPGTAPQAQLPPGKVVDSLPPGGKAPQAAPGKARKAQTPGGDMAARRDRWAGELTRQVRAQFRAEHARLRALLAHPHTDPHTAPDAVRQDLRDHRDEWAGLLAAAYLTIGTAAGRALYAQWRASGDLPRNAEYEPPDESPQDVAAALDDQAAGIVTTSGNRLADALGAVAAGVAGATLLGALEDVYGAWTAGGGRASAIGATEANGAWHAGLEDAAGLAAGDFGLEVTRTWLTAGDDRVRPAHDDADGQTVGLGEPFNVGGEDLMYPGDPAGSDGNIAGCRCYTEYAVTGTPDAATLAELEAES